MKTLRAYPPNIKDILRVFNLDGLYVVFTYGDTLYNPSGSDIPTHLMKHEETHMRQQAIMGIKEWWDMYLSNQMFRLSQEVEAYHNQFQYYCRNKKDHYKQAVFLDDLASDLSSAMYGNIVSREEARTLIAAPLFSPAPPSASASLEAERSSELSTSSSSPSASS